MKEKIMNMLYPLLSLGIGLLFVVLMALGYVVNIDGYGICGLYQSMYGLGFVGFCVSFFQFFHIISFVLLINLGILGILQKTGVVEFKKALKGWSYEKLLKVVLIVMASLALVVLLFCIIICATNGIRIGVGAILNTILEIMIVVAYYILDNVGLLNGTYQPKPKQEKVKKVEEPKEEQPEEVVGEVVEEPVKEEKVKEEPKNEGKGDSWL